MVFFLALFGVLFAVPGLAQQTSTPSQDTAEPTRKQLETQISILKDYVKKLESRPPLNSVDPSLKQAYLKAREKEYNYIIEQMNINIRAYRAQEIATYVILCLVVLVVSAGVAFSGFQLWKSVGIGVQSSSELEVSASKVRVTSSVVGVVVLVISLVFLYIYTKEIYHIQVVPTASQQNSNEK